MARINRTPTIKIIEPISAHSTGEAAASRAMNNLHDRDRDRFIRMLYPGFYSWSTCSRRFALEFNVPTAPWGRMGAVPSKWQGKPPFFEGRKLVQKT